MRGVHDLGEAGLVVGTEQGGTVGRDDVIADLIGERFGATVTPVDGLTETIMLVEQGRVDATINAKGSIDDYLAEHPEADIKIAQILDQGEPVAYPVRKGAETETLVAAINDILEAARQDGTLAALSEKYFGTDLTQGE